MPSSARRSSCSRPSACRQHRHTPNQPISAISKHKIAYSLGELQLRQRFQEVFGARSALINQLADQARGAGLMRFPDDPAHFAEVNQLAWLVSQFWLSFLDLGETPATPEKLRDGARLMVRLLDPYLTAKGRREAKRALAESASRPHGQ